MRRQYVSLMNQAPESIINGQVVKGQGELTDSRVTDGYDGTCRIRSVQYPVGIPTLS